MYLYTRARVYIYTYMYIRGAIVCVYVYACLSYEYDALYNKLSLFPNLLFLSSLSLSLSLFFTHLPPLLSLSFSPQTKSIRSNV